MEKLAKKLANNIAKSLVYDNEKEQVIAYGLTAIIQMFVTILLVLLIGITVGTPVEALIICFSVSVLRKYSGGAHVGTIEECTSISIIYCIVFSLISKRILLPLLNIYWLIALIIIIYTMAFILVYKLVPVDSPKKPIKTDEKKKRMRRGSFLVLFVYGALSIIFIIASLRDPKINSLGISLLFGIIWQIGTLTKYGFYFLNKIDFLFSKVIRVRREVD
jgi:accessory gene regulator B